MRNLIYSTYTEKLKQSKYLFKKLIKDEISVFYAAVRINKTLLNKARKSFLKKIRSFISFILNQKIKIFCMKMMKVQK